MLSKEFFSKKETESLINLAKTMRGNSWIMKLLTLTLVGMLFTGGCSVSEGPDKVNGIEPIETDQIGVAPPSAALKN